jgi:hypothetical protein
MRQRILCLVLVGLLVAPVAGLAKGWEIDPNGRSASGEEATVEPVTAVTDGSTEPAAASSVRRPVSRWLGRLGLSY